MPESRDEALMRSQSYYLGVVITKLEVVICRVVIFTVLVFQISPNPPPFGRVAEVRGGGLGGKNHTVFSKTCGYRCKIYGFSRLMLSSLIDAKGGT
jgi:hypothetical protein